MSNKTKHFSLEKWFNDDTTPDPSANASSTPVIGVSSPDALGMNTPSVEDSSGTPVAVDDATATPVTVGNTPTKSPTDILSTMNTVENALGGLAKLGGTIGATVMQVENAGKGGNANTSPTKTKVTTQPAKTVLGMSPVVLIGGVVFIVLIVGVGIYLATRKSGGSAPAPAPAK